MCIKLVRGELNKIFKNKLSVVVILVFACIYMSEILRVYLHYNYLPYYEGIVIQSSTEGHIVGKLINWLLPLYFILMYGMTGFYETKIGYYEIILLNVTKKRYISSKIITAFILGVTLFFVLNMCDLTLNIFRDYYNKETNSMFEGSYFTGQIKFIGWKLDHIVFTLLLHTCLNAFYFGVISVLCTLLGLSIKEETHYILLCVILNFVFYSVPFIGVSQVLQPFIEGTPKSLIFKFVFFTFVMMTVTIVNTIKFYKGKDYVG